MRVAPRLSSPLPEASLIALMMVSATLLRSTGSFAQTLVIENVETAVNDVGLYTSVVLDASGNPHVSFQDNTANDLKYAFKSEGAWTIETADGSANDEGLYTAIAVDAAGNPHVSYLDNTTSDLKYARRSGTAWTIEVADGSVNLVGSWTSLALDASGNPHITYLDQTTDDLKYARKSGGVWTIETADGSANNVGSYTSLVLDSSGNPHVSYEDVTTGDLKYARKSGGVWTREMVDVSANEVGRYSSLGLDASGNPRIAYRDNTASDVKYASKSGGVWTIEIVDGRTSSVGVYTSLALDAAGNACVAYLSSTSGDLKYARKRAGVWTKETLDASLNSVGFYTDLAVDAAGNPHVTYQDNTAGDLKYAYMPSVRVNSPQGGATWAVGSLQTISWSFTGGLATDNSDIYLSVDGGNSFLQIRDEARDFSATLRVPHTPTRFAQIKVIRPSGPFVVGYSDSFFTIDATITLAKFDATHSEDGTRLTWETRPGPEADIRYRVECASNGLTFGPIADGLDRGEFVDPSPATASRYRLIAVNGLGEEYVLGETSIAAALSADRDIIAYPNPASGPIEILYRVPVEREVDLSIYDVSGRRLRSLAAGHAPLGVQTASWDRRDESGHEVAAGVYFLRLRVGDGHEATERVTIVR
ncbi:MAG: T9SS type A sorting domain-containing protein [bacterium]